MDEGSGAKVRAAVYAAVGLLWLALTGTCTWNYGRTPAGGWEKLWPIGLWFASLGLAPLAIGLQSFVPARALGAVLLLLGAAWLAYGVDWGAKAVIGPNGATGGALGVLAVLWLTFQVPGLLLAGFGVRLLRRRPAA